MVLCRFYQQGKCRYGDNCRNEHPGAQDSQNAGFASQNRFSAFGNAAGSGANQEVKARGEAPWGINVAEIKNDLTAGKGRPEWILSTYGPAKNLPASLLEGNEVSFEELRQNFYNFKSGGNEMQAGNEAVELWSKAEREIAGILQNVDKVIPFILQKEKTSPNRYDFLKMTGAVAREQIIKELGSSKPLVQAGPSSAFTAPSFGQPSQPTFGQSGLSQTSTATSIAEPDVGSFGQPLGTVQASQSSGFGQPSLGQPSSQHPFSSAPATGFGQPSNPTSMLGSSSQQTSAFGQPFFGQPSQPSGGFSQPSRLASGFGAPSNPPSGFGQPSQNAPASGGGSSALPAFGQPSQPTTGFGKPSQPALTFGQPAQPTSAFGQPSEPSSSFGQAVQTNSGFGQPSQPGTANNAAPPFGQAHPNQAAGQRPINPFGSGNTTNNGFGQPSQPTTSSSADRSNPFLPTSAATPTLATTPMGTTPASTQALASTATTSTSSPHPLTSKPPIPVHYTQCLPAGRTSTDPVSKQLTIYHSRTVQYINDHPYYERPDGRGRERIWFPNGPDNMRLEDVDMKDEAAYDLVGVKEAYSALAETGGFEMGKMPVVPPKREWVGFDF